MDLGSTTVLVRKNNNAHLPLTQQEPKFSQKAGKIPMASVPFLDYAHRTIMILRRMASSGIYLSRNPNTNRPLSRSTREKLTGGNAMYFNKLHPDVGLSLNNKSLKPRTFSKDAYRHANRCYLLPNDDDGLPKSLKSGSSHSRPRRIITVVKPCFQTATLFHVTNSTHSATITNCCENVEEARTTTHP